MKPFLLAALASNFSAWWCAVGAAYLGFDPLVIASGWAFGTLLVLAFTVPCPWFGSRGKDSEGKE